MLLKRVYLFCLAILLTGCASISDGTRAIAYGWVDVSEGRGAKLQDVLFFKYDDFVETGTGLAERMQVAKFQGGYVFWHFDVGMGEYAISNFQTQTCLVVCGPINEYRLGIEGGAPTKIDVVAPQAYFMGKYTLSEVSGGGLLARGSFDFQATRRGPSQAELVAFLRTRAPTGSFTSELLQAAR